MSQVVTVNPNNILTLLTINDIISLSNKHTRNI